MRHLLFFTLFFSFVFTSESQVVPNDSIYKNTTHSNMVDSIAVYRVANAAKDKYDLIVVEKFEDMEFEITSRGALIDVVSHRIIENFQYKGEAQTMQLLKASENDKTVSVDVNAYLYEDKNSNSKSYFYYFSDQENMIYRKVSKKKTSDIIIYYVSPKK